MDVHAPLSSHYKKYASALIALLIASLPFFSVRPPAIVLSPPQLMLMLISVSVVLRCLLTVELVVALTKFDFAVFVYLAIALVNLSIVANADGAAYAFVKTVIYVGSYFCLKHMLQQLSLAEIEITTKRGVFLGSVLFLIVAIGCLVITGQIRAIARFDYYSLTRNIFSSIDTVLGRGGSEDFEGRDVMRNAVAEAFTFFFLSTLVFKFKNRATQIFILALNVIFVIGSFSRRAFYGMVIVVFGGSFFDQAGVKRGISMALLIGSVVIGTMLLQEDPETRLTDLSDGGRGAQYVEALTYFTSSPWWGMGYGSKLDKGSYVHNFVLGSAAMLGMSGLLTTLYIYFSTIFQFFAGLAKPRQFNTATFLVIPILGMTVGSTVEGLFTITSWVSIAFYAVCSQHQGNLETGPTIETD